MSLKKMSCNGKMDDFACKEDYKIDFEREGDVVNLLRCFRDSLIGRNAKGIVHNMNSPLQVLSMHLELLAMDLNHLAGIECDNQTIAQGINQASKRLEQIEEVVSKINDLIKLVASRAYDQEEQEEHGPIMITQLLQETLEFWKSDLFFKHKVSLELFLPDTSPVVISSEVNIKDGLDGILFGLIEMFKKADEPRLEVNLHSSKKQGVFIRFVPKGVRFPVEKVENISTFPSSTGQIQVRHGYLDIEPLVLAMTVAKTSLEEAGCEIGFDEEGVTVRLKGTS